MQHPLADAGLEVVVITPINKIITWKLFAGQYQLDHEASRGIRSNAVEHRGTSQVDHEWWLIFDLGHKLHLLTVEVELALYGTVVHCSLISDTGQSK